MLLLIMLAPPRSVFCDVWTCLQGNTYIFSQAIYEVAFANSSLTQPFYIYSIAPWKLISPNVPLSELQLHGTVLVVEESDEAQDPLVTLAEVCKIVYTSYFL